VYPYGLIGNCETAALVATTGAVDWFCYPRFDSPSIFAAILDRQRGGSFRVSPVNPVPTGEQVYLRDTNILTTTFHRSEGTLVLTDFMPCFTEGERFLSLKRICRGLEARGGPVEVECVLDPAPAYGRARTSFAEREGIVIASGGSQEVILSSTVPLHGTVEEVDGRPRYVFRFTVEPGPQVWVTLGFGERYFALGRKFPSSSDATELAERTRAFWVSWLEQCLYQGPFQDAVRRSALVIKLLTYAPTGALCAAPTTSIPEDPGGDRNWDYRYCWLRDASYGIAALFRAGFSQEAVDFINWIRDRAYDHDFAMQILYRVDGDPHLPESFLEHLAGYEGARPVRIGNRASGQRQLDVFGAVIDCMAVYQRKGGFISTKLWHVIERFADGIWELSREPDNGIWEIRGDRQHLTHSKVMVWVALDRGILRGPLVGGFRRRPQLLAPPGARLAQRAALVRRDAQRPGERLATGVELGCPREDLDERALRRILRFRGNWQRARRERAEDGPQGGEDRLEGSAVTIGQAAHLSLQRGARASVHFSSGTDTPSSPRSTTRSGNSPPPPTLPIPRALPGRAPEASRSSCASSCLLCGLLACSLHRHRRQGDRP